MSQEGSAPASRLGAYINFFKAHERLLIAGALAAAALWAHLAWIGYRDRKDAREQGTQHERLQSDAAAANARLEQAQRDAADVKELLAQSNARIASLEGAILTRDRQTSDQQAKDRQLAPDQLAARVQSLAPGGTVATTPDQGYRMDRPEAEAVAAKLELIGPLQADLADLRSSSAEKDRQAAGLSGQVMDLTAAVDGLKKEMADTGYVPDKKGDLECRGGQCQTDVKAARDKEARKHRKLEVVLAILGYVAGRKL